MVAPEKILENAQLRHNGPCLRCSFYSFSPFLETTCKLTPQVKKVRKVMIKVKRRQGTIIRDEVWILLRALS